MLNIEEKEENDNEIDLLKKSKERSDTFTDGSNRGRKSGDVADETSSSVNMSTLKIEQTDENSSDTPASSKLGKLKATKLIGALSRLKKDIQKEDTNQDIDHIF